MFIYYNSYVIYYLYALKTIIIPYDSSNFDKLF